MDHIAFDPQALRPLCYDYGRIEALVSSFISQWRSVGFEAVVAIARGGLVPAVMASTELGLPLYGLAYARGKREVSWFTAQKPAAGCRVLLVEDVAGRGTTLTDCRAFLHALGYEVAVFALAHDAQSRIVPDYGIAVPDGFKAWFPWERHSITPAFAATNNQPDRPEHEYVSWAIDLDGVLLADLPEDQYAAALHDTLAQRDVLPPNESLPGLDLSGVTIITGRPEQDRRRTELWLARHGFHGPLVMRDDARYSASQTPQHKADAILRRCHTHFIESDPVQSLEIARLVKVARIVWWNGGQAMLVFANEAGDLRML